jgi:hypothetical protein
MAISSAGRLRSDDVTAQHRMQRGYAALNVAARPHVVLLNWTLSIMCGIEV